MSHNSGSNGHDLNVADHNGDGISRRTFLQGVGVAGGLLLAGSGLLGRPLLAKASNSSSSSADEIKWDYEVDVLVVGAGATGLPAAIRAKDLGASVLVIEQNFDVGGRMAHSGGYVSLGGGDHIQKRDMAGAMDPENFVTVPPVHKPEDLDEDPDFLFHDMVDWSVVDPAGQAPYRYNERDLHRAWADNCAATRRFLSDNYIRWERISGTHGNGGMSRARRARPVMKIGSRTDIKAGTITREDAGIPGQRSSHFAPALQPNTDATASPGTVGGGAVLSRSLEYSAREKGVKFMLNRHLDELIREQQFSGRVLGIKASYTPRFHPKNGQRLESLWRHGNIDERREVVYIKARRAVIIGSGGHAGNPQFRSMFYPAMRDPYFPTSGHALLGPNAQNASGIIAGMRVGANLAGMQQNLSYSTTFHVSTRLATRDAYTDKYPGHPTFPFRGSTGITLAPFEFENLIAVNQVGKRFYNEVHLATRHGNPVYPGGRNRGVPASGVEHKQADWRNSRVEWVREMYNAHSGLHAALAINEGSEPPDYLPGPIWAIFDQAAVDRAGWDIGFPHTADNGQFFKADTIEELAHKVLGNPFQKMPLRYLRETVERWNSFVSKGEDDDFERHDTAPMHAIGKPPFYAASIMIIWHDSYGGLRINGNAQVVDMEGKVIPGLYAGGEASGGGNQHGLGRALVHGYIAGTQAAHELPVARTRPVAQVIA